MSSHKVPVKRYRNRRKIVFWFRGFLKKYLPKETIYQKMAKLIKKYKNLYIKSIFIITASINETVFGALDSLLNNPNLQKVYQHFILKYYNFALSYRTMLNNSSFFFTKKSNSIVYSVPAKQLYVNISSLMFRTVVSAGIIRKVLNEDQKAFKKKPTVVNSLLKFSSIVLQQNMQLNPIIVTISRNILLIQKIITYFIKRGVEDNILYVLYNPRIQFDTLNFKKRSSIKKRLQKAKKYVGD